MASVGGDGHVRKVPHAIKDNYFQLNKFLFVAVFKKKPAHSYIEATFQSRVIALRQPLLNRFQNQIQRYSIEACRSILRADINVMFAPIV